jgi:hypothetical protein
MSLILPRQGIPATQWPPHAQWAFALLHGIMHTGFSVSGVTGQ